MRIVFFGTPEFAVPSLRHIAGKYEVVAVVCQPDRRSGRGHKLRPPAVKTAAIELGIDVLQPENINSELYLLPEADVYVVVAYGQIFCEELLAKPRLGCVNLHASLLPKYRGAAPIERAVEAGDKVTGITTMLMNIGMDTGDMIKTLSLPVLEDSRSTAVSLAAAGGDLLCESIEMLDSGTDCLTPQDHDRATYAAKISRPDMDYSSELLSQEIVNKIRAFGFFRAQIDGQIFKIFEVEISDKMPSENRGHRKQIYLETRDGSVRILRLQPPNSRQMPTEAYLLGIGRKEE